MASSSSSSFRQKNHQVFLSFRGGDSRLNFTSHLLNALKDRGINVFYDEDHLKKGEQISQAFSEAIATSNLSIIVLSKDYASSNSCLAELSDIMDRKDVQGHIVLPIFYHVNPSHVRRIGGSFGEAFEKHESRRPTDEVNRWKAALAQVGNLKGWHIEGSIFDRSEAEFIKDIVEYVIEKLRQPRAQVKSLMQPQVKKLMEPLVFLSFRDEDTRYNFTTHLYEALRDKGHDVFFDEDILENREGISKASRNAIADSNLSIIVLSEEYSSSESCLAELSDIMDRKRTEGHIVLPIFYHVDPSHMRNIGGSFMTSFEKHESNRSIDEVKRWKSAFFEVCKLQGWHIGGKFDRSEIEHIKDIVEYVTQKLKPQAFLSFRGEDTRLNFTSHLVNALKENGINVFLEEEKLEKGKQISQRLSQAIAASDFSLVILSANYASSKSCLAELSDIMDHYRTKQQIVLPIFYHINPSHVRHLDGSFRASFEEHESKWPADEVKRWKSSFADVGKLKGWHIGDKFDRPEAEFVKDIVEYVVKQFKNSKSRSAFEELVEEIDGQKKMTLRLIEQKDSIVIGSRGVGSIDKTTLPDAVYNEVSPKFIDLAGIDDQKKMILRLIEQEHIRVIGVWGMAGIGKTTLAEAVYNEIYPKFESGCFIQNVGEKVYKQGTESLQNELLSKLLNQQIHIDTPSIRSTSTQERLKKKKVLVVLDDVDYSDQIDCCGVNHFGDGSKIIVTSRDRRILFNCGADIIHEVKRLNHNESLQLFSSFAFKHLHPEAEFQDLSKKFVAYAQGNPLVLKVLGSTLYNKPREVWESEVVKLKEFSSSKSLQLLERSYWELNDLEQRIFLDIAIFFKGLPREEVEAILSSCYGGDALCGIQILLDKCLLESVTIRNSKGELCQGISMNEILETMGKDIVRQKSKNPFKRGKLWDPKDVIQVLEDNYEGTESIEGIRLDMTQIDSLRLCPTVFEEMHNLRIILFYFPPFTEEHWNKKLYVYADQVDSVSLPCELRYLCWEHYPFKSLSSNFNPKFLVVLKLPNGEMEQLWNENDDQDLANLKEIDLTGCKNLKKIPNLSRAQQLKTLNCYGCNSLVELPCLNHLPSLEWLNLCNCYNLKKFPEVPNHVSSLDLTETGIEEVPDSIHLVKLAKLVLRNTRVKNVWAHISKCESLRDLDLSHCQIAELPEIPRSLSLSFDSLSNLRRLNISSCKSVKVLAVLPPCLQYLDAHDCTSLEEVAFTEQNVDQLDSLDDDDDVDNDAFVMLLTNCLSLNQDSVDNIEAIGMLKIRSLAGKWARKSATGPKSLFCCFRGNEISANKFENQSMNSSLLLKLEANVCTGGRFLVFAICLVADLTPCRFNDVEFICDYQLTGANGDGYQRFKTELTYSLDFKLDRKCIGDHVLILSSNDMVQEDNNYEEALFEFYIKNAVYSSEGETEVHYIKVEKCGVHVFYVDSETYASAAM